MAKRSRPGRLHPQGLSEILPRAKTAPGRCHQSGLPPMTAAATSADIVRPLCLASSRIRWATTAGTRQATAPVGTSARGRPGPLRALTAHLAPPGPGPDARRKAPVWARACCYRKNSAPQAYRGRGRDRRTQRKRAETASRKPRKLAPCDRGCRRAENKSVYDCEGFPSYSKGLRSGRTREAEHICAIAPRARQTRRMPRRSQSTRYLSPRGENSPHQSVNATAGNVEHSARRNLLS